MNWPTPFEPGTCKTNKKGTKSSCNFGVNGDGTKMSSVFANPRYANKTLMQVLWEQPGSLEFHVIAALLNAASGLPSYVLSVNEVKDIYNQWRLNGFYRTSNNIRMFAPDIRKFIENTYH